MFGSDWPVCLLVATYPQMKQLIENYVKGCSEADKENIFGGNAARFYELKRVQHGFTA